MLTTQNSTVPVTMCMSGLLKRLIADLEGVTNWVEQNSSKLNEAKTQML